MKADRQNLYSQRGSLFVELLIAIPLLFILAGAIGVVSQPMLEYSTMQEAAKIGARIGSIQKRSISIESDNFDCDYAELAAKSALREAGKDPDDYEVHATAVSWTEAGTQEEQEQNNFGGPGGPGGPSHGITGQMRPNSTGVELSIARKSSASGSIGQGQTARATFMRVDANIPACKATRMESPLR